MKTLILLLGLCSSINVFSNDLTDEAVHIFQRDQSTIVEYRRNGQVFMVKVTPDIGLAYYFFDKDGDGVLEPEQHTFSSGLIVPQWVLYSW